MLELFRLYLTRLPPAGTVLLLYGPFKMLFYRCVGATRCTADSVAVFFL